MSCKLQCAIARRETALARLRTAYEVCSKAEIDKHLLPVAGSYLSDLNNLFNEFSTHHNDVISALDLEAEGKYQEHDAFRVEADKCYFGAKSLSFKFNSSTKAKSAPPIAAKRSLKVLDVQIPPFSGTITEWITFIGLYKTLVHDNPDLAAIEKFQLLLTLVRNEPLSIVQAIPISSENYSIAYDALVARYQNDRQLSATYINQLLNASALQKGTANEL